MKPSSAPQMWSTETTTPFEAMAPRVAKTTDRTVATKTSDRMARPAMTVAFAMVCRRDAQAR